LARGAGRENRLLPRAARRSILQNIVGNIEARYNEYAEKKLNLSTLNECTLSEIPPNDQREACRNCYDSPKSWNDFIDDLIAEAQSPKLRGRCPYCGAAPADTMDHYAPRQRFPEFSILLRNLVPCCGRCNRLKDELWTKPDGTRFIFNFYYDSLPTTRCLFAKIQYGADDAPKVSFTVESRGGVVEGLLERMRSHFEELELDEAFRTVANDVVTDTFRLITRSKDDDPQKARTLVEEQTRDFALDYGLNHWKTAVSEALSESDDFLLRACCSVEAKEASATPR
jgi:hypothetical protein